MEIVAQNPKGWKLIKVDGLVQSGYWGNTPPSKCVKIGDRYETRKDPHDEIDNFFFSTGIRAVGYSRGRSSVLVEFEDWLDDNKYFASVKGVELLLYALQDGNVIVDDGYLYGVWTYKKMGSSIGIMPCYWDGNDPKEYETN